ncbi:hypothetical protein ACW9H6_15130 [Pseudomonas sp. SDO528_S397]
MGLTTTILVLVFSWLAVAAAMLWGVLRITRRHHHPQAKAAPHTPVKPVARHA